MISTTSELVDVPTRPSARLDLSINVGKKSNAVVGIYYSDEDAPMVDDAISPSCDSMDITPLCAAQASPSPIIPSVDSPRSISTSLDPKGSADVQACVSDKKKEIRDKAKRPLQATKKRPRQKKKRSYDMNLVPNVEKNTLLLHKWREFDSFGRNGKKNISSVVPTLVPCDRSFGSLSDASDCKFRSIDICVNQPSLEQEFLLSKPCEKCSLVEDFQKDFNDLDCGISSPFGPNGDSVIWIPQSRSEWEDCIDEMTAVCTAAAWHRHKLSKKAKALFYPPLSRIYIRDRIDVDDPMIGYQIRHKKGWLQGFIMMTTFTTWTHFFKWDSLHPQNGITICEHEKGFVDNGTLSSELELQSRSGDPTATGVVWPTVAEISLVGALGCGEYLVQLGLDDLSKGGRYDYVVLQATETSRSFYEKLGFIRVGAVSKYGSAQDFENNASGLEEVGYRHWTYANETTQGLNEHGAPSIIMAYKINASRKVHINTQNCVECNCQLHRPSFIDMFSKYFVKEKPEILPLFSHGRKRLLSSIITPTGEKYRTSKLKAVSSGRSIRNTSVMKRHGTKRSLHQLSDVVLRPSVISQESNITARVLRNSSHSKFLCGNSTLSTKVNNPSPESKSTPLRKQKIINMYRDPKKIYFFNKVVTPKEDKVREFTHTSKYFFVLNYNEETKMIRVIPLNRKGTFKGKREGRQKWKATVLERECKDDITYWKSMGIFTSSCSNWNIVPAYMVTKCSSVAEESWDIFD